jgi:hypothetical protein
LRLSIFGLFDLDVKTLVVKSVLEYLTTPLLSSLPRIFQPSTYPPAFHIFSYRELTMISNPAKKKSILLNFYFLVETGLALGSVESNSLRKPSLNVGNRVANLTVWLFCLQEFPLHDPFTHFF